MKHGLPSKYGLYISSVSSPETRRTYKQMDDQNKDQKRMFNGDIEAP